jgi:hypothetical protein
MGATMTIGRGEHIGARVDLFLYPGVEKPGGS